MIIISISTVHWTFDNIHLYKIPFRKFDLKGSTVDREASDKELEKQLPTLKDNDFIKQHVKIYIGHSAKEKLFSNLQADVDVRQKLIELGKFIIKF